MHQRYQIKTQQQVSRCRLLGKMPSVCVCGFVGRGPAVPGCPPVRQVVTMESEVAASMLSVPCPKVLILAVLLLGFNSRISHIQDLDAIEFFSGAAAVSEAMRHQGLKVASVVYLTSIGAWLSYIQYLVCRFGFV